MPGSPHRRRFTALIEEQGGDDVIFDRIAAGEPITKIVLDYINPDTGKPYNHSIIYYWIHASEEREEKWETAKKVAAYSYADQAGEILDDAKVVTSADASMAQARANHKKWLAETFNRRQFGKPDPQQAGATINIENLHLQALQAAGSAHKAKALKAGEDIQEADFEVVPDAADEFEALSVEE